MKRLKTTPIAALALLATGVLIAAPMIDQEQIDQYLSSTTALGGASDQKLNEEEVSSTVFPQAPDGRMRHSSRMRFSPFEDFADVNCINQIIFALANFRLTCMIRFLGTHCSGGMPL